MKCSATRKGAAAALGDNFGPRTPGTKDKFCTLKAKFPSVASL